MGVGLRVWGGLRVLLLLVVEKVEKASVKALKGSTFTSPAAVGSSECV